MTNKYKIKDWPPMVEEGSPDDFKRSILQALILLYCPRCQNYNVTAIVNTVKWQRALMYGFISCPRCLSQVSL